MRLYLAKCEWYDEYEDEDKIDKCFVFGNTLTDAAGRLEAVFPYLSKAKIEELCCDCTEDILYIPSPCENLDELINANRY